MRQHLFVRVDPGDSYPLEWTLDSRPLPGFPDCWAIACKRTEDMGITDPMAYRTGREPRMGQWDQPVSKEFARRVFGVLEHATIPWSLLPDTLDGPTPWTFVVELGRIRLEWQAHSLGDDGVSQAVRLMIDAVERPVPVLVPTVTGDRCEEPRLM